MRVAVVPLYIQIADIALMVLVVEAAVLRVYLVWGLILLLLVAHNLLAVHTVQE